MFFLSGWTQEIHFDETQAMTECKTFGSVPSAINMGQVSSFGIATRYGLDGPGIESQWGARFSAPVQTSPGPYPASCTMGTGSSPGVNRPGRGAGHPLPSKCRGHERVGLYLYSPSGPSWTVIGRTFTLTFYWQNLQYIGFPAEIPGFLAHISPCYNILKSVTVLACFLQYRSCSFWHNGHALK